eukprot:c6569_g1_i1.p1 GENE.c6569_g1_i1~~c6569_g1_i1.p1  ORF type:complete len:252 (+),score=26.99 c6569_g1_i1:121-876(+)
MNQKLANVKCLLDGVIRRFQLDGSLGHQGLVSKISELYGLTENTLVIKYPDEEGDLVTIGCDEDLAVALELCPELLKVTVGVGSAPTVPTPTIHADREVSFVLKNGSQVTLNLGGDALQKLGLSTLSDSDLQSRISRSRLGDLVLVGLLNAETARQIFESHDLRIPKSCREGFEGHHERERAWRMFRGEDSCQEIGFFGRGRRGRGGRGGRGHGRWHPFAPPHQQFRDLGLNDSDPTIPSLDSRSVDPVAA